MPLPKPIEFASFFLQDRFCAGDDTTLRSLSTSEIAREPCEHGRFQPQGSRYGQALTPVPRLISPDKRINGRRLGRALRQWSRRPFPVSSTAPSIGEQKANGKAPQAYFSRKKVFSVGAVITVSTRAASLESAAQSHMGTNLSFPVSPPVPFPREQPGVRVLRWFRRGSPFGAYCCARKQGPSLKDLFRMMELPGQINHF
jgi:hypothetical protein